MLVETQIRRRLALLRHIAPWLVVLVAGVLGIGGSPPFAYAAEGAAGAADGLHWIRESARQGNVLAQETLAVRHYFGDGASRDYAEAVSWLRLALEGGAVQARALFAGVSPGGSRQPSDIEAVRWLRLGAEKGIPEAQEQLGVKLYLGDGVPKDAETASKWLQAAAQRGSARGQYYLSRLYLQGDGVPKDPAQALEWLRRSAEQGFPAACLRLGTLYTLGLHVPSDDAAAAGWFRRAADGGSEEARSRLWGLQRKGRVAPVNDREARDWLRAAAEAGDPEAERRYGDAWFSREGFPHHLKELAGYRMAAFWYRRAALGGNAKAQVLLARMISEGRGMQADPEAAFAWASLARAAGLPEADGLLRNCGELLGERGIEQARRRARSLSARIADRPPRGDSGEHP